MLAMNKSLLIALKLVYRHPSPYDYIFSRSGKTPAQYTPLRYAGLSRRFAESSPVCNEISNTPLG